MKIYTKTGDKGQTSLIGGTRVQKNHKRLEAYGTLDELNAHIGTARACLKTSTARACLEKNLSDLDHQLQQIQNEIFNLGSQLACANTENRPQLPELKSASIERLETWMDQCEKELPPLQNFILPGGSQASSHLHTARTVCRRAERSMIELYNEEPFQDLYLQFINRLSDALFVMARWANHSTNIKDELWTP